MVLNPLSELFLPVICVPVFVERYKLKFSHNGTPIKSCSMNRIVSTTVDNRPRVSLTMRHNLCQEVSAVYHCLGVQSFIQNRSPRHLIPLSSTRKQSVGIKMGSDYNCLVVVPHSVFEHQWHLNVVNKFSKRANFRMSKLNYAFILGMASKILIS